ncbi:SMP-30/gluconolactonase/LRE family protein [soil metagenome]
MDRSLLLAMIAAAALVGCQTARAPASVGSQTARPLASVGSLERLDPAFDALVPRDARIEVLAEGFHWSEGPVWRRSGGYLLFTDVPGNTIYRWQEGEGLSVFLRPSGYSVGTAAPGREAGSNGLTFDAEDRLVMADHGNRMVARLDEETFVKTPLAERYQGRRFNSPNDVVFNSRGDLFFTDPPYGLRGGLESPLRELEFSGVYRLSASGELTLLDRELRFPNGITLSPHERTLYVANSDPERAIIKAYDLRADGTVAEGRVLFDATEGVRQGKKGLPDGLRADRSGNLFATGPGGVLVITPEGRHLGTIETGQATANVTFGDDGSTLYMTAHSYLMRIRTSTRGAGF